MGKNKRSINYLTLTIFAPILILIGAAGFVIPPELSLTSGAAPYNIFHVVFGVVGLALVVSKSEYGISFFNAAFGLLDLYQALASRLHLPPVKYFQWTRIDDILHILIGAALVIIGAYGILRRERETT
jgi:hypothetical protein